MSLKVWLPLDGNLNQQGASNIEATSTNLTLNTSGKIGSCYSFNGSNSYITLLEAPFSNSTTEFSYTCWAKFTSLSSGCLFSNRTATQYTGITIFVNNSGNILFDAGNERRTKSYTFATNIWYHLAFTYKNGDKKKIYINGTEIDSITSTDSITTASATNAFIGASQNSDTTVNANYFNGQLNDVRIYDHCLSAAEVHEISQGLVLHYKLDGVNNASVLPSQYQQLEYIESSGTSYFDTGYKFNAETDSCKIIFKSNNTSHNGIILGNSTKPYFWFYYYGSNGIRVYADNGNGQQGINGGNNNLNEHTMEFKNKTYYLDDTNKGTLSNTYANTANNLWLFSYGGSSYPFQGRIYYTEIKKNNDYQRIFIPAKRLTDSVAGMYDLITNTFYVSSNVAFTAGTTIGTLTIQDSSGYGHNGTIVRNLTTIANTPRYSTAMSFSNSAAVKYTNFNLGNIWSAGVWFYSPSTVTTNWGCLFAVNSNGGDADFKMNLYIQQSSGKLQFTANGQYDSTQSFTKDTWHHLMETFDGSTVSCYLDGVLIKTKAITNTELSRSNLVIGARSSSADGSTATGYVTAYMSDFRIYCTALSAAEVKQLYEVSAKVDNNQGWHTFEYIDENSKETITKTGKTMGHNIIETYIPLYDKTIYTEPDGSKWIHIFHHNNPANSKFDSPTTDWLLGKYMDANRWYDVDHAIYNSLSPYEFMVKQKTTSSAAETKYRWRQTANPLTATWTDVKPGTPTFITTTGYTSSSMGGLYIFKSGNLHMCIANGSNGNWFGGIGAASAYNGGIPGYPNTTVTDGYIDLYIRVYANAKIIKTIGINAANLIEL